MLQNQKSAFYCNDALQFLLCRTFSFIQLIDGNMTEARVNICLTQRMPRGRKTGPARLQFCQTVSDIPTPQLGLKNQLRSRGAQKFSGAGQTLPSFRNASP